MIPASEADAILKRYEVLKGNRGTWESHWEEIALRVLPRQAGSFQGFRTPGDKRTEEMYDATAAIALERFAAAMESMLTPRSQKWHRLRASLPDLNRDPLVRRYFDEVAGILFRYRYAPRANFASQMHEDYMALGAFGTGALFLDPLKGGGVRYKSIHLAEVFFCENHQGIIDTAYRRFNMTARQMVQKWGEEKLPERIVKMAAEKPDDEFEVIHCVMPREDVEYGRADYKGMAYSSQYLSVEGRHLIDAGGYETFPYAISRYVTAPGEVYGRSPAMTVLPNIKVLNEQKKTALIIGHRLSNPVLLAHDDGVIDTFSLKPGAINAGGVDGQGRKLVHALDMPNGQLPSLDKLMEAERAVVNDAFLVTLFQILIETPQMTATEVLERAREKGALLSPTMGRQQSECLGPMIERELDILNRQGLLPPMPPILAEASGEYSVDYDSPLNRTMRAEEASGFMRTLEMALNYATASQDPSALDWFDFDKAIPEIADIQAAPARWLRSQDEVNAVRGSRSQQAAVQQMTQAAPGVAALMKASAAVTKAGAA